MVSIGAEPPNPTGDRGPVLLSVYESTKLN